MLCTAETNALGTQLNRVQGICRGICVGAYTQGSELISPLHDALKVAAYSSFLCSDVALVDLSCRTIQGNVISLMECMSAKFKYLSLFVNLNLTAAGYTAGSHATCNNCRMAGHAAADSQDTLCCVHTLNILWRCLQTNQDNSLASAALAGILSLVSCKVYLTSCSARRCRKRASDYFAGLQCFRYKGGMQQLI